MTVDLRSDTVTRPDAAMLQAMLGAVVGDDVLGDDPTVMALEARGAALTGKEAGLFVPSGTMANQLALLGWCRPGDEVLMEATAHPFHYESGGPAALAGVTIRPVAGDRGVPHLQAVWAGLRGGPPWIAPTALVWLENTANTGGGTVVPLEVVDALVAGARERGLPTHLDGARLFNAAVALGVPAERVAAGFDSVTFCLSKGLGAPAGSVLCGPRDWIHRARRLRKMLGGAMRQAGYLAAAGLHALEHNVADLAHDHRRARALYDGARAAGFEAQAPDTNMVFLTVADAGALVRSLADRDVLAIALGPHRLRLTTHRDVDDAGIAGAVEALRALAP